MAICASAEHLSPAEALSNVLSGAALKSAGISADRAGYTLAWQTPDAGVYAFNNRRGGYVIAAGDTDMGVSLIGFSDTGRIDPADMPPALEDMLRAYSVSRLEMPLRRAGRRNIAPLLSTKWDQGKPYNNDCPLIGSAHAMTGCPATAIAQVLNHKRYPDCGVGVATATVNQNTVTANLADLPIDWDNMTDNYTEGAYSDAQAVAVANLMYVAGMAVNTDYGQMSSGASALDIVLGLTSHLKFDKSMRNLRHDLYTTGEWNSMVYEELAADRPLVYLGFNTMSGHAFVCDGYNGDNGDYFHINWGWSGLSDGYFLLSDLSPIEQGSGGSDSGYNKDQVACFNIVPDFGTPAYSAVIGLYGCFGVKVASILKENDPEFCATAAGSYGYQGFYNLGVSKVTGTFGVKFVDTTTGDVNYAEAPEQSSLNVEGRQQTFIIPAASMPGVGEYTVTPVFKPEGLDWIDVAQEGSTRTRVTLTVTDRRFKFAYVSAAAMLELSDVVCDPAGTFVNGQPVKITCTATASGDTFSDNLVPVLCQGTTIVSAMKPRNITLEAGRSAQVMWNEPFEVSLAEGSYNFYLIRESDFKAMYGPVTVAVTSSDSLTFTTDDGTTEAPVELYDLRGMRVSRPLRGNLYIMRRGDTVTKLRY